MNPVYDLDINWSHGGEIYPPHSFPQKNEEIIYKMWTMSTSLSNLNPFYRFNNMNCSIHNLIST